MTVSGYLECATERRSGKCDCRLRRTRGDAQALAMAWPVCPRFGRAVRNHGAKIAFGEMRSSGVRGLLILHARCNGLGGGVEASQWQLLAQELLYVNDGTAN
jgi:hypothetical protein